MAENIDGRFVWYELLTPDPKSAIAFYTEVVGWKSEGWGNDYTIFLASQGPLAGVYALPEQAAKSGAPPHWIASVHVADVDAIAAKAKSLGGKIFVEPHDIPKIGRVAVVGDPQGAPIEIVTFSERSMPLHEETKAGEFTWNELLTTDHGAAFEFYSQLFGWKHRSDFDMGGPMGKYLLFGNEQKDLGGMFTKTKDMPMPPCWTYYIHVEDLDAAIDRAKAKSAKLINGPMEVPGGARVAQLVDPQGAHFALHGT